MLRNRHHAARTDRPQTTRCALARRAAQHRCSRPAAGDRGGDRAGCRRFGSVQRRAQYHVLRPARAVSCASATHVDGSPGGRPGCLARHLGRAQYAGAGSGRPVARPGRRLAGGARTGGRAGGPDQHDPAGRQRRHAAAGAAGTRCGGADLRWRPAAGDAGVGGVAAAALSPGTLCIGRADAPAGRQRAAAPGRQCGAAGDAGSARRDGDAARRASLARDRGAELSHHRRAVRSRAAGAAVVGRCRDAPDRLAGAPGDRTRARTQRHRAGTARARDDHGRRPAGSQCLDDRVRRPGRGIGTVSARQCRYARTPPGARRRRARTGPGRPATRADPQRALGQQPWRNPGATGRSAAAVGAAPGRDLGHVARKS